jgi:septum formation protein
VPELILASGSPYRRELLARFGLPFETLAPQVSEAHLPRESAADRALRLAVEKARSVVRRKPRAVVIGSDQVATAGEQRLDKPGEFAVARAQLATLSGRSARFYTACAVLAGEAGVHLAHVDTTTVVFRHLSTEEIERYLTREQPYDCAGSFKVEALGISLIECIESQDPTALVGLPLIWLAGALREAGLLVP